jgi:hypothetical protein
MVFKKLKIPFASIFVILGIFVFYKYVYDGTVLVKSNFDNNYYRVRHTNQSQEKANLLAILNLKLNTIVNTLEKSNHVSNINVRRLISNWKKGVTIKETGNFESDAAYVINKQYMSFCLPETKSIDDLNLMTYVGIHELAHIMSNETGHGNEFINNFQFLLDYSKTLKYLDKNTNTYQPLYIQLNKLNTANNYCGVPLINSIN